MANIYTTIQGDTWDTIAKKMYDDESKIGTLMERNLDCLDTFIFDAGTDIYIPDVEEEEYDETLPDWRDDNEEDDE